MLLTVPSDMPLDCLFARSHARTHAETSYHPFLFFTHQARSVLILMVCRME
jgi:hypothetical protein